MLFVNTKSLLVYNKLHYVQWIHVQLFIDPHLRLARALMLMCAVVLPSPTLECLWCDQQRVLLPFSDATTKRCVPVRANAFLKTYKLFYFYEPFHVEWVRRIRIHGSTACKRDCESIVEPRLWIQRLTGKQTQQNRGPLYNMLRVRNAESRNTNEQNKKRILIVNLQPCGLMCNNNDTDN